MGSRIPYGYRIIGGKAYIDENEAASLKLYFKRYLEGLSMSEAARQAHLPHASTTLRNLLRRKEYTGTDYYPAIITKEYQQRLIAEWESRKGEIPRRPVRRSRIGVRIYTDFRLTKAKTKAPDDPVRLAAQLYQRIRPTYQEHMDAPAR